MNTLQMPTSQAMNKWIGHRAVLPRAVLPLRPSCARRAPVSMRSSSTGPVSTGTVDAAKDAVKEDAAATEGAPDGVTGAMLEANIANNNWVRAGVVIVAVSAVAGSSVLVPQRLAVFVHLASYAVWTGANFWNTFFVGITMFKNMPRQQFGRVQAKLFPAFFSLTGAANILVLGTLLLVGDAATPGRTTAEITLGVALLASLANWLVLEPKCTSLMFERYDLENKKGKDEADAARIKTLYGEFGAWHAGSAITNLGIIGATFAHAWFLAGALKL